MDKIVGIDLGTSTSVLSAVVDGEPMVVPDSRGNRVTPSYIHIMEGGKILVGPQAKAEVISDPYSTIWATKRLLGRKYNDPRIQEAKKNLSYKIQRDEEGNILVTGRDRHLTPVEVGAIILKYLTRIGKKSLGHDIKKAVLTVPAYFTDPQRKATRECGTMIGLEVVRLINEPTAAALAYGYENDTEQTVAVYDLGGGTFDLSILSIGQGVFEVVATAGDSYLGGEDFDNRLVDYLVKDFQEKYKINIYNDKMAHQRVKDAAERSKIALSRKSEVEINLPGICPDVNRWAGVEAVITAEQYEGMVEDLVDRTTEIFGKLLQDVSMDLNDIDNVIMVGGMTRMPLVKRKTAEFIGREPDTSMNPDEAVAVGAAIHAAGLAGEKLVKKKPPRAAVTPTAEPPRPGAEPARTGVSDQEKTMPGVPGLGTMEEVTEDTERMEKTSPGEPGRETLQEATPEEQAPQAPPPAEEAPPAGADEFFPMDRDRQEQTQPQAPPQEAVEPEPYEAAPADETAEEPEEWMEAVAEEEADEKEMEAPAGLGDYSPGREALDEFFAGGEEADLPADTDAVPLDEAAEAHEKAVEMGPAEDALKSFEEKAAASPSGSGSFQDIVEVATPRRDQPEAGDEHPVSAGPIIRDYEEQAEDLPADREAEPIEAMPEEAPEEASPAPPEEEQLPVDAEAPQEAPPEAEAEPVEADQAEPVSMEPAEDEPEAAEPGADQLPADPARMQEFGSPEEPVEAEPAATEAGPEKTESEEAHPDAALFPQDASAPFEASTSEAPESDLEAGTEKAAAADTAPSETGAAPEEPAPPESSPAPSAPVPQADEGEEETYQAPVLLDVLSQSVGLAHFGGLYVPLIKRFAKLPARASQVFTTCTDNQKRIKITVMQGDGIQTGRVRSGRHQHQTDPGIGQNRSAGGENRLMSVRCPSPGIAKSDNCAAGRSYGV
ncbi:MAG: Hsp70 family protein [bacterium]